MAQPVELVLGSDSSKISSSNALPVSSAVADGGNVTLGAKTDAKSTATDTTSVSIMSVLKQVSASIQTFVFGTGTATAALRVVHASNDPVVTQWTAGTLTSASQGYSASATFTPAATSHTAGDCNGAAGTFTAIGPASGKIRITGATLEIDGGTAEATAWRLYLYNVTPPSATADDAAWDLVSGDRASFLGYVDVGTAVDLGSTQWVETFGIDKQITMPASGNLFGYLINLTTVSTAAVAHIVTLHSIAL